MSQTASKTVHTTKSYSIWNIRSLTIMALMTALLIVSTYIKIPLPFSTARGFRLLFRFSAAVTCHFIYLRISQNPISGLHIRSGRCRRSPCVSTRLPPSAVCAFADLYHSDSALLS